MKKLFGIVLLIVLFYPAISEIIRKSTSDNNIRLTKKLKN